MEVIEAIVASIRSVYGVHVLAYESDSDHNRSVVTFVGTPQVVQEAAFNGIAQAAQLIDMEQHRGVHPRLGAADVVPFIPIEGVSMDDCVQLARSLGQQVGDKLGIPVYLYEAAAMHPERKNLEDIRSGQYERLRDVIGKDPKYSPDFGPDAVGSAGATIIGARKPLIAFNVYLTTDNVEIARRIARAIRHSSGGLRFVKALGLLVKGRAQVSMNLTDYLQTPIQLVFEMIRRETARYGVAVESSELVGLIPQQALFNAAQWYLQLDNFDVQHVLEHRLAEVFQADTFLDDLSSANPTPAGGAAAAYSGAMAASLIVMIAKTTLSKRQYVAVHNRMKDLVQQAEHLRNELSRNVNTDTQAYNEVIDAYRLPKETDGQREIRAAAIQRAMVQATEVPFSTATNALAVLQLAVETAETGNHNAVSDSGTAGYIAQSAFRAAVLTVKTNIKLVQNHKQVAVWLNRLDELERDFEIAASRLDRAVVDRSGIQ